MRFCAMIVLLAGLPSAPAGESQDRDKAVLMERKKCEWLWELVRTESEDQEPYTVQTYLTIAGDKWTVETLRRKQQWTIRLAPDAVPKSIDLVQTDAKGKETIEAGIYTFDKDTLTVCTARVGKPRPAEFKSTAGVVRVFKRVEKKREPVRVEARTRDGKVHSLEGRDAILECIMNKKQDKLVLLLKEGHDIAEPYQKDGSWTFLHLALSGGNVPAAEALIAAGPDVNASFKGGPTPLKLAEEHAGKLMIALLRSTERRRKARTPNITRPFSPACTGSLRPAKRNTSRQSWTSTRSWWMPAANCLRTTSRRGAMISPRCTTPLTTAMLKSSRYCSHGEPTFNVLARPTGPPCTWPRRAVM